MLYLLCDFYNTIHKEIEASNMWNKIKEHWDVILGLIVGLIGIIPSVNGAFFTEYLDPMGVIPVLFVLAIQIIVVFAWAVTIIINFTHEKKEEELQKEISKLNIEKNSLAERIKQESDNYQTAIKSIKTETEKIVSTIISGTKEISKLNNDFSTRIPDINNESYGVLSSLESSGMPVETPQMRKVIVTARYSLSNGMFDLYKRYSTQMISKLVHMVEASLRFCGIDLKVACSVKLFNKPFDPTVDAHNKVFIYTAFRDAYSYSEGIREIGIAKYNIDKNTDFQQCLSTEEYFINNIEPDTGNYSNEHDGFSQYYNCTVVVPIRAKQSSGKYRYLGYLCCDCKTTDTIQVFTHDTARLLYSVAQHYAVFLETMDSNWQDRFQGSTYLEEICQKTFKGN